MIFKNGENAPNRIARIYQIKVSVFIKKSYADPLKHLSCILVHKLCPTLRRNLVWMGPCTTWTRIAQTVARNELKPSIRASLSRVEDILLFAVHPVFAPFQTAASPDRLCAYHLRKDASKMPRNLFAGERAAESRECVSPACPA